MENHIDVGNSPGIPDIFLPEKADVFLSSSRFFDVLGRIDQEAAGATSWVVKGASLLRFEVTNDNINNLLRGIKLSGSGAALVFVRKPFDQIFVGIAQNIHRGISIAQINRI